MVVILTLHDHTMNVINLNQCSKYIDNIVMAVMQLLLVMLVTNSCSSMKLKKHIFCYFIYYISSIHMNFVTGYVYFHFAFSVSFCFNVSY